VLLRGLRVAGLRRRGRRGGGAGRGGRAHADGHGRLGAGGRRLGLHAARGLGLRDDALLRLARALGRAAGPFAQALQFAGLREVEDREHGQAEERHDTDVGAVLLDPIRQREREEQDHAAKSRSLGGVPVVRPGGGRGGGHGGLR
jgi:hypothetical protein